MYNWSLWGSYHLKTASEIKSDLRFKISDPKYLHSLVHVASKDPFGLWGLGSNLTSDLKSVGTFYSKKITLCRVFLLSARFLASFAWSISTKILGSHWRSEILVHNVQILVHNVKILV